MTAKMVLRLEEGKGGCGKKLPLPGLEPHTSHYLGEYANHYTTVTALSTLSYTCLDFYLYDNWTNVEHLGASLSKP